MGEYAKVKGTGERIKIGTCESMYYLRADQAGQVWPVRGSVDPVGDRFEIRFRFPFPDEDGRSPGNFAKGNGEDFDRDYRVSGVTVPAGVDHRSVQFTARNGYLLSIPCPESIHGEAFTMFPLDAEQMPTELLTVKIGKNGYGGAVGITSQKWVAADEYGPERLVTVCKCRGCGALYRLHAWKDAEPVVVAIRTEADDLQRRADMHPQGSTGPDGRAVRLHQIADRIAAGYFVNDPAVSA
jgi:hypothetical protein